MGKGKRKRQAAQGQSPATQGKGQQSQPSAKPKGQPSAQTKQKSSSAKGVSPKVILVVAGVALVVVIAIIAGRGASSVTVVDGKVSRIIATVDECASTRIELELPAEVSTEEAATAIFDRLSTEAGVGLVTVYEDDPRVEIDYCQSYSSEPALRQALAETGYVSEQAAPSPAPQPAPAPGSAPLPESPRE